MSLLGMEISNTDSRIIRIPTFKYIGPSVIMKSMYQ